MHVHPIVILNENVGNYQTKKLSEILSIVLNVCNLLHGLAALRLSRMFNRVLDVCENQTMPMTLAQDTIN